MPHHLMIDENHQMTEAAEIMQLTQEAFDLATAACHFDKQENYIGAYDYYDKCILNIDEVMSKLPRTSRQWMELMQIRIRYDDRMEQIKEMENIYNQKNSFFARGGNDSSPSPTVTPNADGTMSSPTTTSSKSWKSRAKYRLKQQYDEYNFTEMDIEYEYIFQDPPASQLELIYWQLKNIKKTIESGGYLTKEIFIPKNVWTQSDVKFSGVSNKMNAFETIVKLITTYVDTLYLYQDEDSLNLAADAFQLIVEDLIPLQNQLSKSFSYIKEIPTGKGGEGGEDFLTFFLQQSTGVGIGEDTSGGNSAGSTTPPTTVIVNPVAIANNTLPPTMTTQPSGQPITLQTTQPTGNSNSNSSTSTSTNNNASSGNSSSKASKTTLTQYMSAIGKNMKKYAEVGLHRLAVALPTRLSSEELAEYTNLICKVCEKVQGIAIWYHFLESLKTGNDEKVHQHDSNRAVAYQGPRKSTPITVSNVSASEVGHGHHGIANNGMTIDTPEDDALLSLEQIKQIDVILHNITTISLIIKEIVGEVLLRDIEYLLDRYLHGMRKSYSRMYWDQDYNHDS